MSALATRRARWHNIADAGRYRIQIHNDPIVGLSFDAYYHGDGFHETDKLGRYWTISQARAVIEHHRGLRAAA